MKTAIASLLLAAAVGTSFALVACGSDDNTSAPVETTGTDASTAPDSSTADLAASVTRGAALVKANGCAASSCHGSDLGGDIVQQHGNYSANITFSTTAGLGEPPAWTVTDLSNAFRKHIDNTGATLCAPMPEFDATTIPDDGVQDIYNYLQSVPPSSKVQPDTDCSGNPLDGG